MIKRYKCKPTRAIRALKVAHCPRVIFGVAFSNDLIARGRGYDLPVFFSLKRINVPRVNPTPGINSRPRECAVESTTEIPQQIFLKVARRNGLDRALQVLRALRVFD